MHNNKKVSASQLHSAVITLNNLSKTISEVEHYLTSEQKLKIAQTIGIITSEIDVELNNHEAYYTGSIESTLDCLGEDYTEAEVLAVFRNKKHQLANQ